MRCLVQIGAAARGRRDLYLQRVEVRILWLFSTRSICWLVSLSRNRSFLRRQAHRPCRRNARDVAVHSGRVPARRNLHLSGTHFGGRCARSRNCRRPPCFASPLLVGRRRPAQVAPLARRRHACRVDAPGGGTAWSAAAGAPASGAKIRRPRNDRGRPRGRPRSGAVFPGLPFQTAFHFRLLEGGGTRSSHPGRRTGDSARVAAPRASCRAARRHERRPASRA